MGRGIIESGLFRSEQYQLELRTTDPATYHEGEAWIRTDIAPETDQIATLRFDNGASNIDIPIYDSAATTNGVSKAWRVQIGGVTGFIPITTAGPTFNQLKFQHNGSAYGVHDAVSAIPDSVVSRPSDNNSYNNTNGSPRGVRIQTDVDWNKIGAKLSNNVSGATRAYVYRISDGQNLGDVNISSLSAGGAFTINLSEPLVSGETYSFVVDAEGSGYTQGYYDAPSFPYTSGDGNISITNGAGGSDALDVATYPNCLNDVGNTGFD